MYGVNGKHKLVLDVVSWDSKEGIRLITSRHFIVEYLYSAISNESLLSRGAGMFFTCVYTNPEVLDIEILILIFINITIHFLPVPFLLLAPLMLPP